MDLIRLIKHENFVHSRNQCDHQRVGSDHKSCVMVRFITKGLLHDEAVRNSPPLAVLIYFSPDSAVIDLQHITSSKG